VSNTLKSWNSVNEGFGTRGKQILLTPSGKRIKLAYKVQGDNMFLIKTVRANDVIDSSGSLTAKGAGSLVNFINSQIGLVNTFGKIDATFFKTKVLVYKVVKDTQRTEKIQFSITDRSTVEGLDASTQFLSTDDLKKIENKSDILNDVITNTEETVITDDTVDDPEPAPDEDTDDADGTESTKRAAGVKFRYQMRSNNTVYLMEFTVNGAIDATRVKGNGNPEGAVSWENDAPFWYTNSDSSTSITTAVSSTDPLSMDVEITNKTDREFFTKIFTDDDFLQKIITEYEEKYGDKEINADNLKNMLYHQDDSKIFPGEVTAVQQDGESGGDAKDYSASVDYDTLDIVN
jgi:hypothetical protein